LTREVAKKVAKKAAKGAAKKAPKAPKVPIPLLLRDDRERVALMEPMLVSESSPARAKIAELGFELTQASAAFRASLPSGLTRPLAELVRSMNCYYSNLIEGHNTHPVDIERAVHDDLSSDPKKETYNLRPRLTSQCSDGLTREIWMDVR
jgi:hypothetical protein